MNAFTSCLMACLAGALASCVFDANPLQSRTTDAALAGAHRIQVVNNLAYVLARDASAVGIYNVADPTAPTLVTSVTASLDAPEDIKVVGSRSFVVNYNSGLIVYDVANPATSTPIIATFTNANVQQMRRIAISGNTAYITGTDGHYLAAVDINTWTYLGRIDGYTEFGGPYGILVDGTDVWVSSNTGDRINYVDASNPASMTIAGFVHDATNLRRPRGMAFDASGSYIVTSSSITNSVIMVFIGASGSRVTSPTVVGTLAPGATHLSAAYDPIVDGNIAYVPGANSDSIAIFDISSPSSITFSDSYSSTDMDNVQALAVVGNYLYAPLGFTVNSFSIVSKCSVPPTTTTSTTVTDTTVTVTATTSTGTTVTVTATTVTVTATTVTATTATVTDTATTVTVTTTATTVTDTTVTSMTTTGTMTSLTVTDTMTSTATMTGTNTLTTILAADSASDPEGLRTDQILAIVVGSVIFVGCVLGCVVLSLKYGTVAPQSPPASAV